MALETISDDENWTSGTHLKFAYYHRDDDSALSLVS